MLDSIGLVGWDGLEPVVLSALTCGLPILFLGCHGTSKTDACALLTKATMGPDARFQKYDAPLLNPDDLIGYVDVHGFKNGKVGFIETPLSIWNQDAVLFDEINRASFLTASKLMEAIRTKKVMGLDTKVKQVFGAVNPPALYEASYMDLAAASRWVVVPVPGVEQLTESALTRILLMSSAPRAGEQAFIHFRERMASARAVTFSEADTKKVASTVASVLKQCKGSPNVQARQGQNMVQLLLAAEKLQAAGVINLKERDRVDLILSCIPEVHGISRRQVASNMVSTDVSKVLVQYKMQALVASLDLQTILSTRGSDLAGWSHTVLAAIEAEGSREKLLGAAKAIYKLHQQDVLSKAVFNMMADTLIHKLLRIIHSRDMGEELTGPVGYDRNGFDAFVRSIFC